MTETKERYALTDFPKFMRFIDNEDMAKWFIVVLKYGFYNRYHSAEDMMTLIKIEFEKLTSINDEPEYIDILHNDSMFTARLADVVTESEVAHVDTETGEEYLESYYYSHFIDIVLSCYDEIEEYFNTFETQGYTNASFPKGQGGKRILWSNQ